MAQVVGAEERDGERPAGLGDGRAQRVGAAAREERLVEQTVQDLRQRQRDDPLAVVDLDARPPERLSQTFSAYSVEDQPMVVPRDQERLVGSLRIRPAQIIGVR